MSLPLILAGAGILNGVLKSQRYYPAAQAPSRADIYGDILGGGLGGYLGGAQLGGGDPFGVLGGIFGGAGGGAPQPGEKAGGGGPRVLNPAGASLFGGGNIFDVLTNGGFTGQGYGTGDNIDALQNYIRPLSQPNLGGLY